MISLRPHQLAVVEAFEREPARISHAEICVAGGKSLIMAELARRHAGRSLILAHTTELVKQNMEACAQLELPSGPCSREIGVNALGRVTVGTIQTVARRLHLFADVTQVIIDETHMVPPEDESQYRKLLDFLPRARVRGVSGTAYRVDGSGSLEESFGPCVYRFTFAEALAQNWVKPLRQIDAEADDIDVQGVKVRRGEWDVDELAHRGVVLAPVHARAALKALRAEGRRRVLVFACDIEHAEVLATEFNAAAGRRVAEAVHSKCPDPAAQIERFRSGQLPIMTSVAKFTVGFNVPEVDALVMCRPVRSRIYYVQALGRGARKTHVALDCVVVDFGGNVSRHGALDMIKPVETRPRTERERKEALDSAFRTCKACGREYPKFEESCPHCGYDPSTERSVGNDLLLRSHGRAMLDATKVEPRWLAVNGLPTRTSNRHWKLPLDGGSAIWWPMHLPSGVTHAYIAWDGRYGFVAKGLRDATGKVHQE